MKLHRLLLQILLLTFGQCQEYDSCPDCDQVDCFPKFNPEDCPEHTKYVANMILGCCPACVHYLELEELCGTDPNSEILVEKLPCTEIMIQRSPYITNTQGPLKIPVFKIHECGPPDSSYQCVNGFCAVEDPLDEEKCAADQAEFVQWQHDEVEANACSKYLWEKKCNPSGQYQRVQAKYSEFTTKPHRKFCVDPLGNRIFGDAEFDDEDTEINCLCSRKIWELENILLQDDVTLLCGENGNYQNLQCEESRCWCVDSYTGHVLSRVVHKDLAKYLSCYDPLSFGHQYLRRCQSRKNGRKVSSKILAKHGLSWLQDSDYECDFVSLILDRFLFCEWHSHEPYSTCQFIQLTP